MTLLKHFKNDDILPILSKNMEQFAGQSDINRWKTDC